MPQPKISAYRYISKLFCEKHESNFKSVKNPNLHKRADSRQIYRYFDTEFYKKEYIYIIYTL